MADSGYCSDENLKYLARKNWKGFVATEKQKHGQRNQLLPERTPTQEKPSRVERMQRKLETKAGAAVYATRKFIVEPVFGQIKQARGFRQFLLRGIEKVRAEWALICMTHNVLRVFTRSALARTAVFSVNRTPDKRSSTQQCTEVAAVRISLPPRHVDQQ